MFRCQNEHCNIVVPPRQPINKIVTERRERTYEKTIKKGKDKGKIKIINGWEIVKEINVCPKCYRILTGKTPKIVEAIKTKPVFDNKPRRKFDKTKKKSWKNPHQKKQNTDNRNNKQEDTPKRKKPVVEVINPIKTVKE